MLMKNVQRQSASVSTPPRIRPTAAPAPDIAAYTAIARLRSLPAGKVVLIRASAAGRGQRGAGALEDAGHEQDLLVRGEAAEERGRAEEDDAEDEHPAAAEQVTEPAAEHEQTAEGQGVCRDDPLASRVGEAEVGLDVGQGDVNDRAVEDDHELGAGDDDERKEEAARPGRCLGQIPGWCRFDESRHGGSFG